MEPSPEGEFEVTIDMKWEHTLIVNPKIAGIHNYCSTCKTEQPYTGLYPYKKAFDDWMAKGCSGPDAGDQK